MSVKSYLMSICGVHQNLVIAGAKIKLGKELGTYNSSLQHHVLFAKLSNPKFKKSMWSIFFLKKEAFYWTTAANEAFHTLKHAITSAPVLALPDFTQPFILETDAFGMGTGALLSQGGHLITYFSKKLPPRMQKQSAYTREFFAINEALAKFCHYLLGHQFIIRTHQRSLKSLLNQSLQTPEHQAWLHKFIGYYFVIECKSGKESIAVDALSQVLMLAWS